MCITEQTLGREAELPKVKLCISLSDARGRILTSYQHWHAAEAMLCLWKGTMLGARMKLMRSSFRSGCKAVPCLDDI